MATVDNYKIVVDVQGEEKVKGLSKAVGGLGTAIAGLGLGAFVVGAAKFADQMFDIASATGLAAGEVNALALAVKEAGGEFNDVGNIVNRFYTNLGDAAEDQSGKAAEALRKVGIGLSELQTLSESQLLNKAIGQLASMEEGAQRTRLGIEIFGKAFGKIDPKVLEEIFKTQDVDRLNKELKNVSDTVGAIENVFFTLQQATIQVLGELTGQTDNFKLSLEDAKKIIKAIGVSIGLIFGAKVLTAVSDFLELMRKWNVLTKIQVGLQAALQALQGPKGWAILAGAAVAAGGAIYGLNKLLEENADLAEDLNAAPKIDKPPARGGAFADATGIPEKEAEAREQARLAAVATTAQMKLQNEEANKLREKTISLIGIESDRANVIKANADAESEAKLKVQDLEDKINQEKAKGLKTNQAVIVEYQNQINEVNKQKDATIALNNAEYQRLQVLKEQERTIKNQKAQNDILGKEAISNAEYEMQLRRARGEITKEDAARELETQKLSLTYQTQVKNIDDEINTLKKQGEKADQDRIKNLEDQRDILDEQYQKDKRNIEQRIAGEEAVANSMRAGVLDALSNIAEQFEPYKMAQDATLNAWKQIGQAIDTFVETGKFSFKDLAKSILQDLAKMIAKALVFKYIFSPIMSSLGLPIEGFKAEGGPVSGNKPYVVGEKGPELFVPKNAGSVIPNNQLGEVASAEMKQSAPIYNSYITNNINALDSKSVAQVFAENRKILLGTVQMAQREMPYG